MSDEQPIIIKKKKGHHNGHHGGAWKVAFADFMTAMMAFFLVMWLVGQKPEVREAVGGYFRDPGQYQMQGGAGILKGSKSPVPMEDASEGMRKSDKKGGGGPTEAEKKKMREAAFKIVSELEKHQAFQRLRDNIKIQLTAEGLRIILNESEDSPAFFEPGSAKLLRKSAVILMTIAGELGHLHNRLVIEGHTDAAYAGNGVYTNWELSADRANAARELMDAHGLRPDQVREVRGFADQIPMIVENPSDARNRRVSIVVLYQHVSGQYDRMEIGADLMAEANLDE